MLAVISGRGQIVFVVVHVQHVGLKNRMTEIFLARPAASIEIHHDRPLSRRDEAIEV
jgi:hypothetical protein